MSILAAVVSGGSMLVAALAAGLHFTGYLSAEWGMGLAILGIFIGALTLLADAHFLPQPEAPKEPTLLRPSGRLIK